MTHARVDGFVDQRPLDHAHVTTGRGAAGTPAAPLTPRSRRAAIAGIAAVVAVAIAGVVMWPSGGETSAAAIVRNAVEALDHIDSYEVVGEEFEPGVRSETWRILIDDGDVVVESRSLVRGRVEETAVTFVGDAVYIRERGQTELRARRAGDGFDTRYHQLLAAVGDALDGADVTEARRRTVDGVEMVRYNVGLNERSIASLSAGAGGGLIADPEEIEALRVCVADAHHVHEIHFIFRDGRTIDVALDNFGGDIDITPPDGPDVD